jgi:signal transduction histidine kinase
VCAAKIQYPLSQRRNTLSNAQNSRNTKKDYSHSLVDLPRRSAESKDGQSESKDLEMLLHKALEELNIQLSIRTAELQKAEQKLKREKRKRKQLQQTLRSLASELVLTEERERRCLATDLHDSVAQSLVLCKYYLDELESTPTTRPHKKRIDQSIALLDQALEQMRSLIFELSPPLLHDLGLEAALRSLASRMQYLHGIKIEYVPRGETKELPDDLSVLLFRSVRELLFNIVKHAKATHVTITLAEDHDHLQIEVVDDGIGFDPAEVARHLLNSSGFGLFSISERLEHLEGSFDIISRPGHGTRAIMTAPLELKKISFR